MAANIAPGWCRKPHQRGRGRVLLRLVEARPAVNVFALHRRGALVHGAVTLLQWPHPTAPLTVRVRADGGRVFLAVDGQPEVMVRVERLDVPHGGYRPLFVCPACGDRTWNLHARSGRLACLHCLGLDWASRHQLRWCSALHQVRKLRARLGAELAPFAPLPPRPRYPASRTYDRLVGRLQRAEAKIAGAFANTMSAIARLHRD